MWENESFSHIPWKGLGIWCMAPQLCHLLPRQAQEFVLYKPLYPHLWPRCCKKWICECGGVSLILVLCAVFVCNVWMTLGEMLIGQFPPWESEFQWPSDCPSPVAKKKRLQVSSQQVLFLPATQFNLVDVVWQQRWPQRKTEGLVRFTFWVQFHMYNSVSQIPRCFKGVSVYT